jgi:hypothetical protein
MPSLLTKNFKTLIIRQIYNLLDLSANSYLPTPRQSYLYAFIGKSLPWNLGSEVPPEPSDSDAEINENYRYGILAKRLSYSDASLVVPRVDWNANTVYNTYTSNTNFYVLNSKDQVFKCLSNGDGVESTDEPELTLSTTSLEEPFVLTSDGYKWKYMYTITSIQKQKFFNVDWMPVVTNKFVSASAKPGSIDIVTITNAGNNYVSGSLQDIITITGDGAGAILKANVSTALIPLTGSANISNTTVVVQGNSTNFTDEINVGDLITFGSESRIIVAINSTTSLNVNSVFSSTQSSVSISRTGGRVQDIIIQERGEGYTFANIAFQDVVGGIGTGAEAIVSISPYNGHGFDAVSELNCTSLMFNIEYDRDESDTIPVDNDFRQVVLLQNPTTYGTSTLASDDKYTLYTKVSVSPGIGDFNNDEYVYQGNSFEESTFRASVISFDDVENELYFNDIVGSLAINQSIIGQQSGAIRVVNSTVNPSLELYSGKILYVENRLPVTRDASQKERIRFILSI